MYKMDVRPLLKAVLDQFFGPSVGLVDMIVEHIPSPIDAAATKVFETSFPQVDVTNVTFVRCNTHILGPRRPIWCAR